MKILRRITLALLLFLLALPVWAWEGKVVGVTDGDSIIVLHDGKGEKIRLYGIDCPEKGQDFGQRAKEFTASAVFDKTVTVDSVTKDRYGRTVAVVSQNSQTINRLIIEAGLAWVYEQYCYRAECQEWRRLEEEARTAKVGLWSSPNPVPPWEFRNGRHSNQIAQAESQKQAKPKSIFHGNARSHIFHVPQCRYYDCHNCTVTFETREEAINAGFRPCKVCNP